MAYNTRRFIKHIDDYDRVHRLEVQQLDWAGGEAPIKANKESGAFKFDHEDVTDQEGYLKVYANPIQKGMLEVYPLIEADVDYTLLTEIFQSDEQEFRLVWKIDGAIFWTGYVLNDLLEFEESGYPYTSTIVAKDFSRLKGQDYPLTDTRQTLITTIADLLSYLGLELDIDTATSWTESHLDQSLTGEYDYLNHIYHETRALRELAGNADEEDRPISVYEALERVLSDNCLILKQIDGKFQIDQLSAYQNPSSVLVSTYDPAGSQTAQTVVDKTIAYDRDTMRVKTQGSKSKGFVAIKRATVEFQHRSKSGGAIEFPSTIKLIDNDNYIDTQSIISDGEQTIEITGKVRAYSRAGGQNVTANLFVGVERPGLSPYYWNGSKWSETGEGVELELTDLGSDVHSKMINILTDPLPADADGTLRVNLNSAFADNTMPGVARETHYLDLNMEIANIDESSSAIYQMTQSGGFSEKYEHSPTWHGDGPNVSSPSALRYGAADDEITAVSWQRRGVVADYRKFHGNILQEIIDIQRTFVFRKEAAMWGTYDPTGMLQYRDGSYYYTGGYFNGATGDWNVRIMDLSVQTGADELEEIFLFDSAGSGISVDSATQAMSIQNRNYNESQIITKTSAAISGTVSSIPINPVMHEFIVQGDLFYVYDVIDASLTEFTLTESQLASDTELIVEPKTISNTIPANSWIIYTGNLISSYITRSDTAIRLGVNNYELATFENGEKIGFSDGEELAAGQGNKEAQFQGVGAELSVQADRIEATVRDVEGNSSLLRLLSNEIVLKVDSGGNIAAISLSGDPDDGTEINIVADDVNINNINFNAEEGTIGSDNFEEAVSGWQIDGDGNAEFNSVALRNGVMEDSQIRNLQITGTLDVPSGNVMIGSGIYESPGLGSQDGIVSANEGALFSDQGIDLDINAGTAGEIEFHDTQMDDGEGGVIDDLVSNANLVGEMSVSVDRTNNQSNFTIRAQGSVYDSQINLVAHRVNVNAIGIFNDSVTFHDTVNVVRKLEIATGEGLFELPKYTDATRPDPTTEDPGTLIYNTDAETVQVITTAGTWKGL